jgi:photosynthetic reaction center H subunit
MAVVQRGRNRVKVNALLASQFENVPQLSKPDQITRDEEERVSAYVGAGTLYATPARSEPWL